MCQCVSQLARPWVTAKQPKPRRPCTTAQEAAGAWEVGPGALAALTHALQLGEDEAVQVLARPPAQWSQCSVV